MNILIIGSKGFIGRNLVRYYQQNNYNVFKADVVVDYTDADRYFLIDASNSDYNTVFHYQKYDLCINCSGAASVPDSLRNPMRDYYLNTVNVFKILTAINQFQPECKFINLGSAAVYGNPQSLPVAERAQRAPLSPYGFHKLQAEQICEEFYKFFNLKTCSLRIFSVYGNGLQKQLFWDLNQKALSGNPIELFGTGNESRDFIHVYDLARAIELVALSSEFKADIINIGNGQEVKIKDAVATFFGFFEEEINYVFSGTTRKGDPLNWKADISKLKSFGYAPTVNMKEGLRQYYDWLQE
ncbi:dTDP-glucose 4,6-dehydratase/UDP-glucose 4-epimerase [Saccharicrinis carchari]|uniref:dTDP-glucose 4,6-dehydratase/UDP-glucose 4-epimerase n=1 Tax=Saccharicrinis carchari TaxID=1168039 RepID=A0A521BTF0_SACCC|nr:NAD-dependent epimerase/dehydratase family protein [Saccharicrinis carchari]SMO50423.1 dTDP-glucose 4,6-dehydratase/UDP-glucose 4-epimerase [Saccharicrinis carchari]